MSRHGFLGFTVHAHHKGGAAKGAALTNAGTGQTENSTLFGTGTGIQDSLLPFLQGEITNPSGLGQPTVNAMTTEAGEATSGSLANAAERAKLQAARSGNVAGQSAIISSAARNSADALSKANLGTQIDNAQEKLKQQQAGAAGLESMGAGDIKGSLESLGLSNEAINAWSGANKSAGNLWSNALLPIIQGDEKMAGAAMAG